MKIVYIQKRFISLIVLVCVVFIVFISRLINWQIINGEFYRFKALQSHSYIMKTPPIRGEILDRFGNGLAVNSIKYNLVLDDFNLPKGKESECIQKILEIINLLKIEWNDNLPIILDENGNFAFDESNKQKLESFKKEIKVKNPSDPNSFINYFKSKIKCENLPKKKLRDICSIYYSTRVNPVVSDKIDDRSMCIISELGLPGFRIETSSERYYPDGLIASHILGYTGLMSNEEYNKLKENNYEINSYVGKSGIEQLFEEDLRGFGGKRAFHFSREGTITKIDDIIPAKPGNSVFLTLDAELQKVAQNALEENIKSAATRGARGCNSGATVVIDVRTGEILAAASYPTFDLSRYSSDKSYYNDLVNDTSLPLLHRAFNGIYPPGSTFKPLIASAALQEEMLNGLEETIYCSGAYNYYKGYRMRCTGVHRDANLLRAMARSCNVFFAELGRRLDFSNIIKYASEFGICGKTGVEIHESAGTIADLDKRSKYKSGASQAAIGQGEVAISMLQLVKIASGIASGMNFRPQIVKKVMDYVRSKDIKTFSNDCQKINISEQNLNLVRQAMREVVLTGLATDFKNFPISVAAKTGTAQNPSGDDHTTFICYAPYESPEIAISVILANGKYGNLSKAVARSIMKAYFKI